MAVAPDAGVLLRMARLFPHASQLIQYSLPGLGGIDAQVPEGLRAEVPARVALRRADQAEQQVLGADVAVAQRPGFLHRELDRLLRLPGHRDPPGPLGRL